jgi:hypothetical protein
VLSLSDRLSRIFHKEYTPILILEIAGLPTVSSGPVSKTLSFDDPLFRFDNGYNFDSLVTNKAILQIVDLKTSSGNFSQRIDQQRSSTSAQTFSVSLVDKFGIVTQWITPGFFIDEIIGKKAKIYLSCVGGVHPFDSVILMNGFVDGESSDQGRVSISLSSAEKIKQSDLFPKTSTTVINVPAITTTLSASVPNDATSPFPVVSTAGFPQADVNPNRWNITINGDLLSYSYKDATTLYFHQFGEVTTVHSAYSAGATVSLYTNINAADFNIRIADVSQIITPNSDTTLTCYVKIDNEVIKYTGVDGNILTGCVRGQLGTTAAVHAFGATVDTMYRLQGGMKDLALKLMLSGNGITPYFTSNLDCTTVTSTAGTITDSVWINDDFFEEYGVVVGDKVVLFYPNHQVFTNLHVLSVGRQNGMAYITIDKALVVKTGVGITITSKYNTLPVGAGLGLTPDLVDVARHEFIDSTYFGQLLTYDFQITDKIVASDFINQQIYRPSGCYPLPRQGKASLGITSAPVIGSNITTINKTNVMNASQIKRSRSISKNFYNAVTFRYDLDTYNGGYNYGTIFLSNVSIQRIKIPTTAYNIDADGVRGVSTAKSQIETVCRAVLTRFQYGAELFENIQLPASVGMVIEAGDVVIFDGSQLNISDIAKGNGTRNFKARYMEVVDKQENPWTNTVKLSLLDTSYSINGRYGTIAPASLVNGNAATTADTLYLYPSFETTLGTNEESVKWAKWVNEKVAIRSPDWTQYQEKYISYITNPSSGITVVYLDLALSFTPLDGYVMELPRYGTGTDSSVNNKAKKNTIFLNPSIQVVSSASNKSFVVASGDAATFISGAVLKIVNPDYSLVSDEIIVDTVVGTTINLKTSVAFTIDSTMRVELIGFLDGGLPYRWA